MHLNSKGREESRVILTPLTVRYFDRPSTIRHHNVLNSISSGNGLKCKIFKIQNMVRNCENPKTIKLLSTNPHSVCIFANIQLSLVKYDQ